jgi:hypothetical protein
MGTHGHDLGFEPNEQLTLRHLAAHVPRAQYAALMLSDEATLRQEGDADVPSREHLVV